MNFLKLYAVLFILSRMLFISSARSVSAINPVNSAPDFSNEGRTWPVNRPNPRIGVWIPVTRKSSKQPDFNPVGLLSGSERILFGDDEAPIARMGHNRSCRGWDIP